MKKALPGPLLPLARARAAGAGRLLRLRPRHASQSRLPPPRLIRRSLRSPGLELRRNHLRRRCPLSGCLAKSRQQQKALNLRRCQSRLAAVSHGHRPQNRCRLSSGRTPQSLRSFLHRQLRQSKLCRSQRRAVRSRLPPPRPLRRRNRWQSAGERLLGFQSPYRLRWQPRSHRARTTMHRRLWSRVGQRRRLRSRHRITRSVRRCHHRRRCSSTSGTRPSLCSRLSRRNRGHHPRQCQPICAHSPLLLRPRSLRRRGLTLRRCPAHLRR